MNGNAAEVDGAFVDLALSTSSHDRVPLTEREQGILDLYDQLCDLRLESELLHAQQSYEQGGDSTKYYCGFTNKLPQIPSQIYQLTKLSFN